MRPIALIAAASLLCSCTAKPVLYPNDTYKQSGKERAKEQVVDCQKQADEFVESDAGKKMAAQMAEGGIAGAAAGAVTGAVFGDLGRGAAAGGIGGAVIGLVRALFRVKQPSPVRRAFVDRCLHDRGYDVVGWQ